MASLMMAENICTFKLKFCHEHKCNIKRDSKPANPKRIYVIEKTIQSIMQQEDTSQLKKAADLLL